MRKTILLFAAAAVLLSFGTTTQAQNLDTSHQGAVTFVNKTQWAMWITIYGQSGRGNKQAYDCVPANSTNTLRNSSFGKSITRYWVLAEVKPSATSCSGGNYIPAAESGPYTGIRMEPQVYGSATSVKSDVKFFPAK